MSRHAPVSRRALLAVGAATSAVGLLGTASATPANASTTAWPTTAETDVKKKLLDLEERYGARLGVYARNARTGATVLHREVARIAFCSTFKSLAAAAVLRDQDRYAPLDRVIAYPKHDLLANSPVTEKHVDTGLSIGEIAKAAIQQSDNTAGNLLLRQIGGPAGLTEFCRSLGDQTTRSDRWEIELSSAIPDDPRDTSTPQALGRTFGRLMLGNGLNRRDRTRFVEWMKGNQTSDERFRAGLPDSWVIADKTGTGDYGVANNVGVAWTTRGTPLLLCVMSTKFEKDAPVEDALIADTARVLAAALAPNE